MRIHTYILGILSIILIIGGIVLKQYHIAGAGLSLGIGVTIFILGFSISFLIDRLSSLSGRAIKISTILLIVSVGLIILATAFKILHLPGAGLLLYTSLLMLLLYVVFFASKTEGRKLQLRKNRQLASILFTDIVGFTAMMGQDEEKALQVLDKNRKIQKRIIRKHRGKWLKEMGDGSMVVFYTATEAVAAAIDIQNAIQEHAEYNVRMGIHISEIFFTDRDVFGDGVNVASRISEKASANEICISDTVFQNIRNREDLRIESMGEMTLKNVSYPVRIFKIDTSKDGSEIVVRKLASE